MQYTLSKTIVLVGLMGAGKTAIGTIVADILGTPFVDSDEEIEKAAKMSIKEIFDRDGEAFFRKKETQVIKRLLQNKPCLLSTGGGAFMSEVNRNLINENSVSLWLKADLDLLWDRVKSKDTRPLLMNGDGYETLKSLYEVRTPVYSLANISVDADPHFSKEDMADKVIKTLLSDPKSGLERKINHA